jgi:tRNA(adenine34) deaminase
VNSTDETFMRIALDAAKEAEELGEVPIGACLVDKNGVVIAVSGNRTITNCDPTAHAEILVIREAAQKIGNYRLTDTTIYTTIEPCAMCAGSLIHARIAKLIFGSHDKRFGAVESVFNLCDTSSLNHQLEITSGVLAKECRQIMQQFFKQKRLKGSKFKV